MKTIIKVRERLFQVSAHPQPGIAVDGLGGGSNELKIIAEQGSCRLEISFLDRIQQGLNSCFCIHNVFLYFQWCSAQLTDYALLVCSLRSIRRLPYMINTLFNKTEFSVTH